MALDLCLPFSFFFFLNQHSSLATLHAFSITMELGVCWSPWRPYQQHGAVSSAASDPTIEHLAPDPRGGCGDWAPAVLRPLASPFSSSHLYGRGVFKTNLVSKKVYICGEGGGSNLRERESVCVCMCV